MAFLVNFKICICFILSSSLFSCGYGQDIDISIFQNLGEINQKWLQLHSIPEFSSILRYPPFKYHSSDLTARHLNFSELNAKSESILSDSALDGNCSDDVVHLLFNLKSEWALQMLDSDGKLSSGILRGAVMWPGHYSECTNVYAPLDEHGHGDFHGKYCTSSWTQNILEEFSSVQLTIGLCVPDSCEGENLKTALKNSSLLLDHVPVLRTLTSYLTLDSVVCKIKDKPWDAASIFYLFIVSIFILLSVIGSSLEAFEHWKLSYTTKRNLLNVVRSQAYGHLNIQGDVENQTSATVTKETLAEGSTIATSMEISHPERSVPLVKRILLCFSIFSNGQKILNIGTADGQLLSIHGIRFLSLTWVILGHTYINSVAIIGNRLDVLKSMDTFAFQMLLQSPFSVDSFFLLSGFLLAYLFLKEATKKKGKINWVQFYVHRLWRLTPSYLIVVFFYMLIFKYVGSGPFWDDDYCDANRSTWWQYVLYINNFIPIHEMCVGWSWYLANDMQFYVISPLFLYPLWKWPRIGFAILGTILFGTWITTGVMSYSYDIIPMFVGVTHTKDIAAYQKRMWESFDQIYDKPYCRIAPYIVGVVLGYILHKTGDRKDFLTWKQQLLGWVIASFCSLSVVFGLYHVEMDKIEALFYNALCRTSFVIGLAWLIYVCETGHGGFLTKLLSWKLFIPLSRLTYSTYLIHPIIVHGYYQAYQSALHFTELVVVTNFLGFLFISFGLAFIFSLVFESPFMNLEKLLIKRKA